MMTNVLLLKSGDAAVRPSHSDYDRWFVQTIGQSGVRFETIYAHLGAKLPVDPTVYDAVIMTGSPLSVTEPTAWMKRTAFWMREAAERKVPVLGVCFGEQLLAWSFGGRVVRNPQGREIGTVTVELTEAGRRDPLFSNVPSTFAINATHEDIVQTLPPGTTLLAKNSNTRVQAFSAGRYIRAVQFHPELQTCTMQALIRARAEKLEAEAVARGHSRGERVPSLVAGIRPTPCGRRILHNFLENFVGARQGRTSRSVQPAPRRKNATRAVL